MAATRADLERVIQQATPRVEDHRTIDRCDFIRREHGHLNLREVINSLDALEFTVDSFPRSMQELSNVKEDGNGEDVAGSTNNTSETAVHALLRAVNSLSFLTPKGSVADDVPLENDGKGLEISEAANESEDGWQEKASTAKDAGGDCFKKKDFPKALEHYNTAIQCTPAGDESLKALFSNRSAVLLQMERLCDALSDACRCIALAPEWPKGHFRKGCCLRQLKRLEEATEAFRAGQALEPSNKDWEREIEKLELLHRAQLPTLARQLMWHLSPELLQSWVRTGARGGVLQVQVTGELSDLGTPKAQFTRERKESAKAQLRIAYIDEKGYMANLAANLQSPPAEGIAVVDVNGAPLKIAEIQPFVMAGDPAKSVVVHLDVKHAGKMVGIIGRMTCDDDIRRFVPPHKDPPPPKGSVEGVLQIQGKSGFSKVLPRFLGFQAYPGGDLNFPVIDLERDAPGAVPVVKSS